MCNRSTYHYIHYVIINMICVIVLIISNIISNIISISKLSNSLLLPLPFLPFYFFSLLLFIIWKENYTFFIKNFEFFFLLPFTFFLSFFFWLFFFLTNLKLLFIYFIYLIYLARCKEYSNKPTTEIRRKSSKVSIFTH